MSNDTTLPSVETASYAINLALGALLLVSELLPFIRSNNYNGLLHFLCQKFNAARPVAEQQQPQPVPVPPPKPAGSR